MGTACTESPDGEGDVALIISDFGDFFMGARIGRASCRERV